MAKTSVTFAVIFFFFSVFSVISQARTSFNLPANEWNSISTTSDSDSDTAVSSENFPEILLPTDEKSESDVRETEFFHPIEKEEDEKTQLESDATATATAITAIGITEPFKVTYDVTFRPINRHFHHHMQVNRPFWYRFPHRHNCPHHHHHHGNGNGNGNGDKSSSSVREISYGNDMIMSGGAGESGEQKIADFLHPMFRGDMRHIIPARLGQFRAGGDRFPVKSFKVNGDSLTNKEMVVEEDAVAEETGFMKRFRKFLFDRF